PALEQSTQALGFPKFALLKILKISARKRRAKLSRRCISLDRATSLWEKPGPRIELRATSPIVPGAGLCHGPDTPPGLTVPVDALKVPAARVLPATVKYPFRLPVTCTVPIRLGRQGAAAFIWSIPQLL